nr:hypothetical protein [Tanacetum cinerariifolium]GEY71493.1 hypothetical protein [Tanacetum cinerariifolium]
MYGFTTNPMQSGRENCVEVNGQSSQQSEHEYINLDDETILTKDTNEDPVKRDIGNNNGKDELELKKIYKTLPVIAPDTKYDANKIREAIANWLMVTEQPFHTVEDEMFIYMMKTDNPLFERISRPTAKAYYFKVYEHEKTKLKTLTNALLNVSLTTDCWRSSHQKIDYMVITRHFIDHNWRLHKRVLNFVYVPPPRTALDIADEFHGWVLLSYLSLVVKKKSDGDDEEEISEDEEVTHVKVLTALADDELIVGKIYAQNGEWVDITIRKVNTFLSIDEDADWQNYLKTTQRRENINEKWLTSSKKVSQCISEQIPHQKKKILGGELLTESLSKININENAFILASMGCDQEMVPKTKEWVKRLNPDSKLPNFNTGRILIPESQVVNEFLETLNTSESSKDSEAEFLTPLPPLKNLQGASPCSEREKVFRERNVKMYKWEETPLSMGGKCDFDLGSFDLCDLLAFIEIIIHSASLDHPCCGALPSCEIVTLGPHTHTFLERNSIHQSCESSVVEAATVGIPAILLCKEASKMGECPNEILFGRSLSSRLNNAF